jgi:hypothetical protein
MSALPPFDRCDARVDRAIQPFAVTDAAPTAIDGDYRISAYRLLMHFSASVIE